MFLLGGDYSLFPRVRLLQKISSLAQLLPFQSLPQILDLSLRCRSSQLSYPVEGFLSYEEFSQKDRAYLMSVQSSHEPEKPSGPGELSADIEKPHPELPP